MPLVTREYPNVMMNPNIPAPPPNPIRILPMITCPSNINDPPRTTETPPRPIIILKIERIVTIIIWFDEGKNCGIFCSI